MIKANPIQEQLLQEMEAYFGPDQRRINHARQVTAYAEQILEAEGGDYAVVMAAAILHDIGIHEAERKYHSAAGHYQEIERPPIAQAIMEKLGMDKGVIDEVCYIIAHHHQPNTVNTLNFRIVYEADMLVNLEEVKAKDPNKLTRIIEQVFLTPRGKKLAKEIYLENS